MNDMHSFAVPDALDDAQNHSQPLRECVLNALRSYLCSMGDHDIQGLYRLVMDEVEQPLFEAVLEHTKGNQSAAAAILGISRGTLRKKLKQCTD
ncbi:MAG: helix-turn-helix domain-containing protein [Lamprobacter sp.]|uniref:helix-turn-helix domain-containing protein n=1 Tax=Lamprobacter sp. TaxID=3100796 RepID=UPI002B25A407|nr:helix-turn-helix domain-containing protein [Lamprobacter sp.]MEA3638432.1 helix-turn-helix domain-containing protein [Lamprobacter sp.]